MIRFLLTTGLPASLVLLSLAAVLFEFVRPIQRIGIADRLRAIWFYSAATLLGRLGQSAISVAIIASINALGGGLIVLSSAGWPLIASCLIFVLTADCLFYWRHRFEHAVPALWALHSFHHADKTLNIFSSLYTYWLAKVIQTAIHVPILGLLFKIPVPALTVWAILEAMVGVTMHLNLRLHWGWATMLLVGPQFHRIHHSLEPQHHDRNFAQTFPIWDKIFGTAWNPQRNEWPDTGLIDQPPPTLAETITWPLRFIRSPKRSAVAN